MNLKYLKSIQYLSYVILVVNFFILTITNEGCINGYNFLWMIIVSLLLCLDICETKSVKIIISAFLFLPLIFQYGVVNKIMIAASCIIVLYLRKKVNKKTSYEQISYPMKRLIPLAIAMLFLAYLVPAKQKANEFIMPYVLMYIFISIIILRIMRDFKYNALDKKAVKVRSIYATAAMIFMALCSLKQVRAAIIKAIDIFSSFIGKILYFFESKIINFSGEVVRKFGFEVDWSKVGSKELRSANYEMDGVQTSDGTFWKMQGAVKAVYSVAGLIILAMIVLSIYRLHLQYCKRKKCNDFIETRENIYKRENIVNKKNKRLYSKLKNGSYKDRIRYYYYRFLKDCISKDIAVNVSDTTYEINKKAAEAFKKQSLEKIRNIYLKAKYTECDCTAEEFDAFHQSYKAK